MRFRNGRRLQETPATRACIRALGTAEVGYVLWRFWGKIPPAAALEFFPLAYWSGCVHRNWIQGWPF